MEIPFGTRLDGKQLVVYAANLSGQAHQHSDDVDMIDICDAEHQHESIKSPPQAVALWSRLPISG